ncbi:glycoside hydrolase family 99-like domain-containing protein [Methylomagnum sp.]
MAIKFNPLDYPVAWEIPDHLTEIVSWQGLIPLAFTLMALHKPRVFVELGTHKGDSYCAFCQAVDRLGLDTSCYAVDTWRGEEHAGYYEQVVLDELRAHHDPRYRRFSQLLQATFDEALAYFPDASIDLLHIDGLHTYEAVKHDFETWLPKMSERGMVLFHDTNVRERHFGVWRLFRDLAERYPALEFKFSHGLGLLAVGAAGPDAALQALFNLDKDGFAKLAQYFYTLGNRVLVSGQAAQLAHQVESAQQAHEQAQAQLQEVWATLAERDRENNRLLGVIAERDAGLQLKSHELGQLSSQLIECERDIARQWETIGARDKEVERLLGVVAKGEVNLYRKQAEADRLREALAELDREMILRWETIGQRDRDIERLTGDIGRLTGDIGHLSANIGQMTAEIQALQQRRDEFRQALRRIRASKSWRLTAPLRSMRRWIGHPVVLIRIVVSKATRLLYVYMPLPGFVKTGFKSLAFRYAAPLFRHTVAYRDWQMFLERRAAAVKPIPPVGETEAILGPILIAPEPTSAVRVTAIAPHEDYAPLLEQAPPVESPARVLAFYLPQFHPIPENDQWWGKGFTEWTNVTRALPQFEGHYQPHLPGELGFYDLRLIETQRRQVELAKLYGIHGFCFYFYWFAGKTLLETPVRQYLETPELDLPFCLCWANENWSRRWDGSDRDILIAQQHSPEDDLAFIRYVSPYLKDPRYIRVGGRPLLMVYWPTQLPEPKETADRWREWCRVEGIGEIYLAYTQSFDKQEPESMGFDAAVEFPPNNSAPDLYTGEVRLLNSEFKGVLYDWQSLVERSRNYRVPGYKLFRGVCPSWDNEARRSGRGTVFMNTSPAGYREWLSNAIGDTVGRISDPDERLVFVNAWNEWAEGTHLEPDRRFGYAYLQATRDAIEAATKQARARQIILVSHDAHPHGAQFLALHLTRALAREFGYRVAVIFLGSGPLIPEFEDQAEVYDLSTHATKSEEARALARELRTRNFRAAICNTTLCGEFIETLREAGIHSTALIHEMPGVINALGLQPHAQAIAEFADKVVFPNRWVEQGFREFAEVSPAQRRLRPQGLYKRNSCRSAEEIASARVELRRRLGIESDAKIILGVGYADRRKGIDLFIEAGTILLQRCPQAAMVWIGHWDATMEGDIKSAVANNSFKKRFFFPGLQADTDLYYAGADVYALTSREDPFPSVILESLDVAIPVVAFEGAGGFVDLLQEGCGLLAPAFDAQAYAEKLRQLINDPILAKTLGEYGQKRVDADFSFHRYAYDLLEYAGQSLRKVSVVVPNYNYAGYLNQRLESIIQQSYPIYELIILDDASTDTSAEVIEKFARNNRHIPIKKMFGNENTGSAFKQWLKGVAMAEGDFVWIAEADDFSAPNFIEEIITAFDKPDAVLSYTQSSQVDEAGTILCGNYLDYTNDISPTKWSQDYVLEGMQELREALAVKNTIPNVSAVIFKREHLARVLREHIDRVGEYKVAGDWFVYSQLLKAGKIAYCRQPLNFHRRHQGGLTLSSFNARQLAEIISMQRLVAEESKAPENIRIQASQYAESLYRQFQLESPDYPTPWEHPEIQKFLALFHSQTERLSELDVVVAKRKKASKKPSTNRIKDHV